MSFFNKINRRQSRFGFTLIELLTVIAIIIILAGLVLSVSRYVTTKGKTSRAQSEIAAMSAACESYKADNGIYPDDGTTNSSGTYAKGAAATLDARTNYDPTAAVYTSAGLVLYRALSGDTNCDGSVNSTDQSFTISGSSQTASGVNPTVYYTFRPSQIITGTTGSVTSLRDPFGNSYGYSTAYAGDVLISGSTTPTHGYNPTFDLWSTTGSTVSTGTSTWITNW